MYRGTNTSLDFEFENDPLPFEMDDITDIWITINVLMTHKTYKLSEGANILIDRDNRLVSLVLSQEDTLSFSPGDAKTQMRIYIDGKEDALCTEVMNFKMNNVLEGGVMS